MKQLRPLLVWIALVLTLVVNGLSQADNVVGAGNTVRDIANFKIGQYTVFFLPDNYVFSIWGVIYIGLIAFAVYQSLPAQRKSSAMDWLGWAFIVSCIANSAWLILWLSQQFALSTVAMVALLVTLITIYQRLGIGKKQVSNVVRWCTHIPFSIYLGWITVATVANFAYTFYRAGSNESFIGIPADVWTVVLMAVAAVLALIMIVTRRDIAYALVVIWALTGIAARFSSIGLLAGGALVTSAAVAIGLVWLIVQMTRRPMTPASA